MSSIENDELALRLGRALKARREQLDLSLRALAAASGVSASMISDVERGEKSPTVSTLAGLAAALGTSIAALVDRSNVSAGEIKIVRGSGRNARSRDAHGARLQSFGPAIAGSRIEFMRYVVPPHTTAGPFPAHAGGTIEHIHVAAGALRVVVGEQTADLKMGDSCSCHVDAVHSLDNAGGEVEAVIYLVREA
jgi:transcriptional regulator with XRE-family HTH domain